MITGYRKGEITMNIVDKITKQQMSPNIPEFRVGDTVKVDYKITEGKRERIQSFEGTVVSRKGGGVSETFTVRKVSYGVGVERIFPINSPMIAKLTVIKKGRVRRAKLTFLKKESAQHKIKERN
jgi:large subunit ribosomal protein L19